MSEVVLCQCEDGSESGARVWRGVGLTTSCDLWAWVPRNALENATSVCDVVVMGWAFRREGSAHGGQSLKSVRRAFSGCLGTRRR